MEIVDLVSDDEVEVVENCAVCLHNVPERHHRYYYSCWHMFCVSCSEEMARVGAHSCPLCRAAMAPVIVARTAAVAPVPQAVLDAMFEDMLFEDDSFFSSDDSSMEWSGSDDDDDA